MQKYNWDAEDYANHSKTQLVWGQELIAKLNLTGNEHVLDIGCGDGKVTVEIAKTVPEGKVLGIDSSEEMTSLAVNKYPTAAYQNLRFELLDAQNINYNQQFDVVFSNAVLHWIPDHQSLLHKIFTSLKPKGRALLQMGGKGNASEIIEVLSKLIKNKPWKNYFKSFSTPYYFHSPLDYDYWLNDIGFLKSRNELIPKEMIHDCRSELEAWIRTTWHPYLKQIPEEFRNKFIEEFTEAYLESHPKTENGTITVKMVRLEVDIIKPEI
jgi:trans-aconitate methyltransferase